MSYILDALKKSDHDRQRESEPQLRSINPDYRAGARLRRNTWWPATAAVLLLVGSGAGLWVSRMPWFAVEPTQPVPPMQTIKTEPTVTAPVPVVAAAPAQSKEAEPATALLEIWQLSEAEQRFLQALDVSLHVYSQDVAQRTVIINGLRVREGQPLGQDLSLTEITSDGIIVAFQGQRVHLSTIAPWTQD